MGSITVVMMVTPSTCTYAEGALVRRTRNGRIARRTPSRRGRTRSACGAHFGAISRGTESLVFAGRVPPSEYERMRGPLMGGVFPFPVKYGYAIVGTRRSRARRLAAAWCSRCIRTRTCSRCRPTLVAPLPDGLPPQRAMLAANMETALNAVWDGAPGPADRIAVVGAGVVGALVAFLCARLPGARSHWSTSIRHALRWRARSALAFAPPAGAPTGLRPRVSHQRRRAPGLRPRSISRVTKQGSSR